MEVATIVMTSARILFKIVVFNIKNTIIGQIKIFKKILYSFGTKKVMSVDTVPPTKTYINFCFLVDWIFNIAEKNSMPT